MILACTSLTRENPETILSEAGVKPGEVVADIGCGTGYFTIPLGKHVRKRGKVYGLVAVKS